MTVPVERRLFKIQAKFQSLCILVTANADAGGANDGINLLKHHHRHYICAQKFFRADDIVTAMREISLIRQLQGSNHTIDYIDYHIDTYSMPHRAGLINNYCHYGSLLGLIARHRSATYPPPETFVWHVFESLAKALAYLQLGAEDISDNSWDPVLHRDIWPANILLSKKHSSGYPRVLLADFGSAVTAADFAAKNVPALRQQLHFRPRGGTVEGPGEEDLREDVSQVGLVMVALCRLTSQPRWYRSEFASEPAGPEYSSQLNYVLRLALSCRLQTGRVHGGFWIAC